MSNHRWTLAAGIGILGLASSHAQIRNTNLNSLLGERSLTFGEVVVAGAISEALGMDTGHLLSPTPQYYNIQVFQPAPYLAVQPAYYNDSYYYDDYGWYEDDYDEGYYDGYDDGYEDGYADASYYAPATWYHQPTPRTMGWGRIAHSIGMHPGDFNKKRKKHKSGNVYVVNNYYRYDDHDSRWNSRRPSQSILRSSPVFHREDRRTHPLFGSIDNDRDDRAPRVFRASSAPPILRDQRDDRKAPPVLRGKRDDRKAPPVLRGKRDDRKAPPVLRDRRDNDRKSPVRKNDDKKRGPSILAGDRRSEDRRAPVRKSGDKRKGGILNADNGKKKDSGNKLLGGKSKGKSKGGKKGR